MEPTATTSPCWNPPLMTWPASVSSSTLRRCISTEVTTIPRSEPNSLQWDSTTSTSNAVNHEAPPHQNRRYGSGCVGLLKAPTRGYRTTGSSAATPTGQTSTATPNSASSPSCSSPPNSSTGATAGAPTHALSARPLSPLERDVVVD